MIEKIKKHQQLTLVILIVICMGMILIGALRYLQKLQNNLMNNAIQDVMNVTLQQKQSFDGFIFRDWERMRGYANYLADLPYDDPDEVRNILTPTRGIDAECVVVCVDEGWACSSQRDYSLQVVGEDLEFYRGLSGTGVRDNFTGLFSGSPKFSYYETFTFMNGHKGVIQKSYDRSKVLETFTLTLYNGQGFGYILNQDGDILLRSVPSSSGQVYHNVFDALTDIHSRQEDISALKAAIRAQETGSIVFHGNNGDFVYTYTPLDSVNSWYLLSIVPVEAIQTEIDHMVLDTQMTIGIFIGILVLCAVLVLLIWRTNRDIAVKQRQVDYQTRMFELFTTYLSSNTNDVYLMVDQQTEKVEYISPNVERVLGVAPEDILKYMHDSDWNANPKAAELFHRELSTLIPGQSSTPRNAERVNQKTGELKYFLETTYCTDLQGRVKRVTYISDRTRERKTQNSLAEALQMARAASNAKSAFLSSVSHDIRTPMNAIIGFLTLMREEADNPAMVLKYTQRIDAASQLLLGLINDVLDMNKIESGSTTLTISEIDLGGIIEELNTIIRPQAKMKDQTFDISVSPLSYEHLLGDKTRINQILINLLSNAIKYTPEGGSIQMRVEELPQVANNYSRVRFTVKDNGLGMSQEYMKVIFEPFTRQEAHVIQGIQGTGLGMAITKSLVDLMGGTIQVDSTLGKGSTFTVELELRIQEEKDDTKFWDDHGIHRMLVVDDDEDVCRGIVKTMSRTGVVTDCSAGGETAVELIGSARDAGHPYDLILLDWVMPGLNGLETARLIRKKYSDKILILLLTAYDWSDIEQAAMEAGVSHFMPKPFFMSTFKEAVQRVMDFKLKPEKHQPDVVRDKHILVVDDIEVNRIILVKILSTMGAVCGTASNGQEAVDMFEASQPGEYDLILMDVQMPVLNGYEATRAIRGSGHPSARTLPIIAMTANAFVDDVRDAIESGMDAHIAKPVQIDTLKATIQEVLDRRSGQAKEAKEENSPEVVV